MEITEASRKRKIVYVLLMAFLTALILRVFVIEGFIVRGDSMSPTILSGDYVLVNKLAYVFSEPQRGDVIVTYSRGGIRLVKRVAGLPGEEIKFDEVKNNIDPGEYFVLGDSMENSIDSRELGFIDRWDIKGKVFSVFRLYRFIKVY